MLATLAAGNMAGLRELTLPLPAAEAQRLSSFTSLSALTALKVGIRGALADLGGLAGLTGLKSLRMLSSLSNKSYQPPPFHPAPPSLEASMSRPVIKSLSPLTALTQLTLLDLRELGWLTTKESSVPSDVSVLLSLAALRVLRVSLVWPAEVVGADLLPVQFRFLRSATALEELDLDIWEVSLSLPQASSLAMRGAGRALMRLKKVAISIRGSRQYHLPMSIFAAAPSIESLACTSTSQRHSLAHGTLFSPFSYPLVCSSSSEAHACLRALSNLRSLTLENVVDLGDLLAGLPSTDLTHMCLRQCGGAGPAPREVMEQTAGFRNLEKLDLISFNPDPRFFAQLGDLKCLTRLRLDVNHGGTASIIGAPAVGLKAAILERARLMGVTAKVAFFGFCHDYRVLRGNGL